MGYVNRNPERHGTGGPRARLAVDSEKCGGEGGIRTHVPVLPDHPISSRRRYDRFGTSPSLPKIPRNPALWLICALCAPAAGTGGRELVF